MGEFLEIGESSMFLSCVESTSLVPTEEDLEFMQQVSEELDGIVLSDEAEEWLLKR